MPFRGRSRSPSAFVPSKPVALIIPNNKNIRVDNKELLLKRLVRQKLHDTLYSTNTELINPIASCINAGERVCLQVIARTVTEDRKHLLPLFTLTLSNVEK